MFYDTERILRKQEKYVKLKAYSTIKKLECKGLSVDEMINALEILLTDDNTEFQESVLERAKDILKSQKEIDDEKGNNSNISYINNLRFLTRK